MDIHYNTMNLGLYLYQTLAVQEAMGMNSILATLGLAHHSYDLIYLILISILGVASYTDLQNLKVYNICIILGLTVAFYFNSYKFFLYIFVSFALSFILYLTRMLAAGDVKLIVMIYGFLGFEQGSSLVLISFALASIYALYYLLSKKILFTRLMYFKNYISKSIKTGSIVRYCDMKKDVGLTMPMSPWFLLGFIVWRIGSICMLT